MHSETTNFGKSRKGTRNSSGREPDTPDSLDRGLIEPQEWDVLRTGGRNVRLGTEQKTRNSYRSSRKDREFRESNDPKVWRSTKGKVNSESPVPGTGGLGLV